MSPSRILLNAFDMSCVGHQSPGLWKHPDDVIGIGGMGPVMVGSPSTVADQIEQWVEESGVDGFNIAYAVTPGTFEDFVEHGVPELRVRGRMRDACAGSTLRDNLQGEGACATTTRGAAPPLSLPGRGSGRVPG